MIHTVQCACGTRVEVSADSLKATCPVCGRMLRDALLQMLAASRAAPPAAGRYYRHSGRFSFSGLAVGVLAGGAIGLAPAAVYAYAAYHSPWRYGNMLLTFLFGFSVGAVCCWIAKSGRVRNLAAALVATGLATAAALYVSWAVWVCIVPEATGRPRPDLPALALSPGLLWDCILRVNDAGAWTLGSFDDRVTGLSLWLVWMGEAAIVFTGSVLAVLWMMRQPFCEDCRSWCRKVKLRVRLSVHHLPDIQARLEAGDTDYLRSLQSADAQDADWLEPTVRCCPGCGHTNTLSIKLVRLDLVGPQRSTRRVLKVLDRLLLSKEQVQAIRDVGRPAAPDRTVAPADESPSPARPAPGDGY